MTSTLEIVAIVHLVKLMTLGNRGDEVTKMAENGFSFSEWGVLSTGLCGGLNEITSIRQITTVPGT